jgi:hypothetical protein
LQRSYCSPLTHRKAKGACQMGNLHSQFVYESATAGAGCCLVQFKGEMLLIFPGGGGAGGAAPNFQINLMPVNPFQGDQNYSSQGLVVLGDKSSERPAAVVFNNTLFIAYTDTTPVHQVQLLAFTDRHTAPRRIPLNETAIGGPALAVFQDHTTNQPPTLLLSFCGGGGFGGAAPNGQINIMRSSDGFQWSDAAPGKTVLRQTSFHSPAMFSYLDNTDARVMLAFTGTNSQVYLVNCEGLNFGEMNSQPGTPFFQVTNETSEAGPSFATCNYGGPATIDWSQALLWTGTGNKLLNTLFGNQNSLTVSAKTTFQQRAQFEPALLHIPAGTDDSPAPLDEWIVAWVGTDTVHHLNVALLNLNV